MASDQQTPEAFPPLRGVRRVAVWLAYQAVMHWPLSVAQRGIGRAYWALLPYAGEWAYHPDGGGA